MFTATHSRLATPDNTLDRIAHLNVADHTRYFSAFSRERIDGLETSDSFVFVLPAGESLDKKLAIIQIEVRCEEIEEGASDEDLIELIEGLDWQGEVGFSDLEANESYIEPIRVCKEITEQAFDVYQTIFS